MGRYETWQAVHPELMDKEWLLSELRAGTSRRQICRELKCDAKVLRKALTLHGITFPFVYISDDNEKLSELKKRLK